MAFLMGKEPVSGTQFVTICVEFHRRRRGPACRPQSPPETDPCQSPLRSTGWAPQWVIDSVSQNSASRRSAPRSRGWSRSYVWYITPFALLGEGFLLSVFHQSHSPSIRTTPGLRIFTPQSRFPPHSSFLICLYDHDSLTSRSGYCI